MEVFQNKKVLVRKTIRSYDYFYELTYYSLKQAEEQKKTRLYNCMITMVFCAFSIEAYVNHLGAQMIPEWETIERSTLDEKLLIISNSKKITLNKIEKPFCYLNMIFDYRDNIAHGRTQTITRNQSMNPGGIPNMPTAKWEEMTTLKAKRISQIYQRNNHFT
jgi:hypothetical protein